MQLNTDRHDEIVPEGERRVLEGRGEMQEEAPRVHRGEAMRSSDAPRRVSSRSRRSSICVIFLGFLRFFSLLFWVIFRWHSAGTFDQKTRTGGPFGTMRFKGEQCHAANNGLDVAVRLLEPIKEQFPILSYADFYQVIHRSV